VYSGDINEPVTQVDAQSYKHAYVDTAQTYINLHLINEMTITRAPILLDEGIPLFAKISQDIKLEKAQSIAFANDFVQQKYVVNYR